MNKGQLFNNHSLVIKKKKVGIERNQLLLLEVFLHILVPDLTNKFKVCFEA
jgi:hypothetical protein